MGVAASARGRGIGAVLLMRRLRDLRAEGFEQGEIYSDGPIALYTKSVNATISRVLYQFAKEL